MKLKKAIQLGNACIKSPLAMAYLLRKLPARLMAQEFAIKYQTKNLKIRKLVPHRVTHSKITA
jgi:hypothetical protein